MTEVDTQPIFRFPRVQPVDPKADAYLWSVLDNKTKPKRSLGRVEDIAVRLGALRYSDLRQGAEVGFPLEIQVKAAVVVAAADHGVADEGVSAYPQVVTSQMLRNFEAGGAAINALCKCAAAELVVVDVGSKSNRQGSTAVNPTEGEPATTRVAVDINPVRQWCVRAGSGNLARGSALTLAEVHQAVNLGLNLANELDARGVTVVALGEMGIGNTTVAAILTSVFCDISDARRRAEVVGRGTGIDDAGLAKKRSVVEQALALHQPDPKRPWDVMTQVGGLEIAFLAGVAVGAAAKRMAVVLDGFISTAAALVAQAWCPPVTGYMIASHQSTEPGHAIALSQLGLKPYLQLDLRLGEGSGAALFLPLLSAAAAVFNDMATFEGAGVSTYGVDA